MKIKISTYAKEHNLTYRTVWQYVKDGKLRHETTPSGTILIVTTDEVLIEKICCKCKNKKPINEFGKDKHNKDGLTYDCKICRNQLANDRIEDKPSYYKGRNEKTKSYRKQYNSKDENKQRQRNLELIKNFNITLEEYDKLLKQQNGVCAICGGKQNSIRNKNFAIDHCHTTGKIRGLLCDSCNRGIGLFKDNIELLNKSIKYLKK